MKNTHKITLVLFSTLFGLYACAYKPIYSGNFIETDIANLSTYWVADRDIISFRAKADEVAAVLAVGGKTTGTIWIDSNGRVTKVDIETSEPPGVFDAATNRNMKARIYSPTTENSRRRPAKVRFVNFFKANENETT